MALGVVLSGPLALIVVALVHGQPPWRDAATFATEFDRVQLLPYLGGFVLIGGCVALIASLHPLVPSERRARANSALVLAAAFATLILFNYVVQTTFVPTLLHPYRHEQDALIAGLTMSNPHSLAWAIEMWGYGVFGLATWAIAIVFGRTRLERATATTFVANGVISVAGAVMTSISPGWAMSMPGMIAFTVWNLLMIAIALLVIAAMRRRCSHA